jgi:hypothetical protein
MDGFAMTYQDVLLELFARGKVQPETEIRGALHGQGQGVEGRRERAEAALGRSPWSRRGGGDSPWSPLGSFLSWFIFSLGAVSNSKNLGHTSVIVDILFKY